MGLDDAVQVHTGGWTFLELQDDSGARQRPEHAAEFSAFPTPFEAVQPLAAHSRPAGKLRLGQPLPPALLPQQQTECAGGTNEHGEDFARVSLNDDTQ